MASFSSQLLPVSSLRAQWWGRDGAAKWDLSHLRCHLALVYRLAFRAGGGHFGVFQSGSSYCTSFTGRQRCNQIMCCWVWNRHLKTLQLNEKQGRKICSGHTQKWQLSQALIQHGPLLTHGAVINGWIGFSSKSCGRKQYTNDFKLTAMDWWPVRGEHLPFAHNCDPAQERVGIDNEWMESKEETGCPQ